nr:MAG TPA: ECF sigma factor [Caudoviricetes sp.]
MDSQHKAMRAQLSSMAPKRAIAYILSFELPDDEAYCLIECDVRRKSYAQVCETLHLSPEAVNRCRRRAYQKIADGQREHRG